MNTLQDSEDVKIRNSRQLLTVFEMIHEHLFHTCRSSALINGVWKSLYCPLWLSVDATPWTFSPLRTPLSWVLVALKGRGLCRLALLWDSWLTFMPGTEIWNIKTFVHRKYLTKNSRFSFILKGVWIKIQYYTTVLHKYSSEFAWAHPVSWQQWVTLRG